MTIRNLFSKKKNSKLYPESLWTVKVSDDKIIGTDYSGVVYARPLDPLPDQQPENNEMRND